MSIQNQYNQAVATPSDINQHLPVLSHYASQVSSVIEAGVRSCVSSWAFLNGLMESSSTEKSLISIDLFRSALTYTAEKLAIEAGIKYSFLTGSDLDVPLPESVDLTFIDTWHVYGHLKRELIRFAPITQKWIILHDTTVDAVFGESIRCRFNIDQQVIESGYPREEITRGLWPAVEEFLAAHPEWVLEHRYTHNNGLTVLRRV